MIGMECLSRADKERKLVCASDETVVSSNVTPCEEIFISEYLTEFDGRVKPSNSFCEDVDYLFDLIYHDDYTEVINGVQVSKEQLKKIHAKHFALGYKASIVQCENVMGSVLVNYRLSNDKNDMFIQSSVTIEGNKFVRARTLDGSFGKFLQISGQPFKIGKLRQ
jgi:hypothetical protein